jgi:hypothetical protein
MSRSLDSRTTVRWSRKTLVAAFFIIFWLVPFVVAAVAGAVAGDCNFTSECTDAETVGLLLAVIGVAFWALVAAPLTFILGLAWMLSTVRKRRQAAATPWAAPGGAERLPDVSVEAMLARDAGARHEQAGVPEEYLWGLAVVLWVCVFAGIVVASEDAWGVAIAGFAAIVAIPLTAMLVVSRLAHRPGRSAR